MKSKILIICQLKTKRNISYQEARNIVTAENTRHRDYVNAYEGRSNQSTQSIPNPLLTDDFPSLTQSLGNSSCDHTPTFHKIQPSPHTSSSERRDSQESLWITAEQ